MEDGGTRTEGGGRRQKDCSCSSGGGEGGNVICRGQQGQGRDFNSLPVSAVGMPNLL